MEWVAISDMPTMTCKAAPGKVECRQDNGETGTNVFVPLFGVPLSANGGVAKVNIAFPASPVITGVATLASHSTGGYADPGYLTVAGGYIFVSAGVDGDRPNTHPHPEMWE